MGKHRRHAPAGDRAKWTDARRLEFERTRRSFEAAASEANQDPSHPELAWLIEYFRGIRNTVGAGFARRRSRDVALYLADHGAADLMNDREMQTVLFCPDDQDPVSFDPDNSIAVSRRARMIGDTAFSAMTMQGYAIHAKRFVPHCRGLGIDHLDASPVVVRDWIAALGHRYGYNTVANARNAISHLFVKHGRPDHARTEEVDQLLAGLRNLKPPKLPTALTSEERYRIITSIETEGLGIRDRVAILICAFSKWGVERAALIDVEHISFTSEGVVFNAGAYKEPYIIGRHHDAELDLEPWIRKLIGLVGETGPLFQVFDRRKLRFAGERLSGQTFCKTIRNAAKRAGVEPQNVTTRLRLLFEFECRDVVPDIVLRHYNVIAPKGKANNPDDRATHLTIRRKSGFSTITP